MIFILLADPCVGANRREEAYPCSLLTANDRALFSKIVERRRWEETTLPLSTHPSDDRGRYYGGSSGRGNRR